MNLWEMFLTQQEQSCKWTHYFPIYERHFQRYRNRTITFLEIGTLRGGSAVMWARYFGPMATVVTIDIQPMCLGLDGFYNVKSRIGNQKDPVFLQSIIDEFGVPNIVLDDGGHIQSEINATFDFLYPKMGYDSLYIVEDTYTSYMPKWEGGINEPMTFMNRAKRFTDHIQTPKLYEEHCETFEKDPIMKDTFAVNFYNGIIVLEKQKVYSNGEILTLGGWPDA